MGYVQVIDVKDLCCVTGIKVLASSSLVSRICFPMSWVSRVGLLLSWLSKFTASVAGVSRCKMSWKDAGLVANLRLEDFLLLLCVPAIWPELFRCKAMTFYMKGGCLGTILVWWAPLRHK